MYMQTSKAIKTPVVGWILWERTLLLLIFRFKPNCIDFDTCYNNCDKLRNRKKRHTNKCFQPILATIFPRFPLGQWCFLYFSIRWLPDPPKVSYITNLCVLQGSNYCVSVHFNLFPAADILARPVAADRNLILDDGWVLVTGMHEKFSESTPEFYRSTCCCQGEPVLSWRFSIHFSGFFSFPLFFSIDVV